MDLTCIVVPLPDLEPVVGGWRSRFDAEEIGVPAHVTVLSPWIPPDELTEADLDAVGQLAKNWDAFEVSFAELRSFPVPAGPDVHWLAPEPAEAFLAMTEDLATCWPEYPPYGGAFGPEPAPHLTVARTATGDDLTALQADLESRLPVRTMASELIVLDVRGTACRRRAGFRLGGKKKR